MHVVRSCLSSEIPVCCNPDRFQNGCITGRSRASSEIHCQNNSDDLARATHASVKSSRQVEAQASTAPCKRFLCPKQHIRGSVTCRETFTPDGLSGLTREFNEKLVFFRSTLIPSLNLHQAADKEYPCRPQIVFELSFRRPE